MNPYSNPLALLEYLFNHPDEQESVPPEFNKIFKDNFDDLLSKKEDKSE